MSSPFIISCLPTSFSLQRLYIHSEYSQFFGKYLFCHTSDGQTFICKGTFRDKLHHNFVILESSVILNSSSLHEFDRSKCLKHLEVVSKIRQIKNVKLKVIFTDTFCRAKWTAKHSDLISTIKNILQLFCIISDSTVLLEGFPEFRNFGFHSVSIITIGIKGVGKVTDSTLIDVEGCFCTDSFRQMETKLFPAVSGQYQVKERLTHLLKSRMLNVTTREISFYQQVLIIGPSGCGKTALLKKCCQELGALYIVLDVNNIFDGTNELAALDSILNQADYISEESTAGLCILLIQRIDGLINRQSQHLNWMINLMDKCHSRKNILIVGTTDVPHLLPESWRTTSRFGVELYLNAPSEADRQEILSSINCNFGLPFDCYKIIAEMTPGFVLADLVLLSHKAAQIMKKSSCDSLIESLECAVREIVPSARKEILGSVIRGIDYSMDNLGGLELVKKILSQSLEWPLRHQDSFKRLNLKPSSGVLLYGPPGCAKTSLVRAISASTKVSFISVSAADLYSPYVGESEKTIAYLFQRARANSPSVLFVDEIDALVGSRSADEKGVNEQVLNAFLIEMDGVGIHLSKEPSLFGMQAPFVFVIGATNRPDAIDSALLRPGRLDKLIYVPPPTYSERLDILKIISLRMPLSNDVSLSEIAEKTLNFSGADLKSLCNEAGLYALSTEGLDCSEITMDHFINAFNNMRPSLSSELIKFYAEYSFSS